ncbi:hypothetical protein YC2023_028166 [Brassica napus]
MIYLDSLSTPRRQSTDSLSTSRRRLKLLSRRMTREQPMEEDLAAAEALILLSKSKTQAPIHPLPSLIMSPNLYESRCSLIGCSLYANKLVMILYQQEKVMNSKQYKPKIEHEIKVHVQKRFKMSHQHTHARVIIISHRHTSFSDNPLPFGTKLKLLI